MNGGEVSSIDGDVSRWVAGGVWSGVEWPARLFTWLGGLVGTTVITVAVVAVLWRAGRTRDVALVSFAVIGIAVLVPVLKAIYERSRPDLGSPIDLPGSYSFPSGHAATAVVLYGALGLLAAERATSRLRAVAFFVVAGGVALAIGSSRVILNVHFVSDVVAGFAVGLAWLCCCLIVREVGFGRR